jgi:hypothetical protein
MIKITQRGNFNKSEKFLKRVSTPELFAVVDKYAREGVAALAAATPIDSGETANSWSYEIRRYRGGVTISWLNTNIVDGIPIAIIIQYGHGTKNGGYVQGRDYINPVLQPIFDKIANELWREVSTE